MVTGVVPALVTDNVTSSPGHTFRAVRVAMFSKLFAVSMVSSIVVSANGVPSMAMASWTSVPVVADVTLALKKTSKMLGQHLLLPRRRTAPEF